MTDVAKADWETKPLGEVATVVNGGTPKLKVAEYWSGDIQWLTPKDMGQMSGRQISVTPRTITEAGLSGSSARLVPVDSVILSTRAPIGHLAMNGAPMAFNQGCRGIIPGDKLDPVYLYHFLNMSRELLNQLGSGTTFKELSATNLKAFKIPLPPLEEQQRIVAVLDEAFEGLARARANAEANLQSARELFENSLEVELAAVGHSNETSLGEHIDLLAGFAFKSASYTDDQNAMRLMRGDNIVPGAVRWDGAKYWPINDCEAYEKFRLMADDVLIAMDRTWIKAGVKYAVLSDGDVPSLLVQRVARLRCLASLDTHFLAMLIGSKSFERYVLSIQTGTGVPHISPTQIREFSFPLPDNDTQAQIIERLMTVKDGSNDLSEAYSTKLQDIDNLRQSLLQRAFAGELT